jgi:hypothetical protein
MRMYGGYGKNNSCVCNDQQARMAQLHELQNGKLEESVTCTKSCSDTVIIPISETDDFVEKITQWHHDRNLIEGATDKDQYCKLIQEAGELSDSICKGKSVADDIGDMMVVLINIAERNGLSLADCLSKAWDDIKDRKGRMQDGVFIKESDDNANS